MITISKEANPNYLAKIVKLGELKKHSNADALQTVQIDYQTVITGMDAKEGDIYVYFPVECKISPKFISHINGFRDKTLNQETDKGGFFEENCRVKAVKLRGEPSMGFIVPFEELSNYVGGLDLPVELIGKEFDTINDELLVSKYVPRGVRILGGANDSKKPKLSRLIDGQVHLHVDTHHLVKNIHNISPNDLISISYKTHGTSWWVGNLPVKRDLKWWEWWLYWMGVMIYPYEYDYVYGSRKVVKNANLNPKDQGHYFGYDLWKDIMEEVKDVIPKNYTLYGECIGYDKNGKAIQKKYDYGCKPCEHKLEVYRITVNNPDGVVRELSTPEIIEFCERSELLTVKYFYYGKANNLYNITGFGTDEKWREIFLEKLKENFTEKDCFMCKNKVPEEGIVLRKESMYAFNAYKLKSFKFLLGETKQLDNEEIDIESEN
jgi:hypothetical protein